MAETVRAVPREVPLGAAPPAFAARDITLRQVVRNGVLAGLGVSFVTAVGMVQAFERRFIVSQLSLDYILVVAFPLALGYLAGRPPPVLEGFEAPRLGAKNVLAGLLAGALAGLVLMAFVGIFGNFDVRDVFTNVSPEALARITFGEGLFEGSLAMLAVQAAFGALGGALNLVPERPRRAAFLAAVWVVAFGLFSPLVRQVLDNLGFPFLRYMYRSVSGALTRTGAVAVFVLFFVLSLVAKGSRLQAGERFRALPESQRRVVGGLAILAVLGLLAVLPHILGNFLSEILNFAGIFLLMALGLNIVVGLAGLLDLGYVAFFAVGAYTTAVLTWDRPEGLAGTLPGSIRWGPELTFWEALPFVILAAALAGIIVGTPVLRMRGDYLAIVTLGFGEITRLLFLSTWFKPYFGGALGVQRIANIEVFGVEILSPQNFFYFIFGFGVLAVYASYALQNSRIGRAWTAIREDESVAEAMGVNVVAAKLWAFIIGAIIASFGGAIFAVKVGSVFPRSFSIEVSIIVLVIVIVGGLASVPGVILSAIVLTATPELLQELAEYRFLIYGVLLIFMMLKRPEGFIPSRRRLRELREEELAQDAWLRAARAQREREELAEPVPGS
ncbi:MAG TPA: leucine/isoleucine/valine transporter permease subunit [Actinomycetota bacterium]|nr:leucine/isoleucine/valine transporter permease subunit [Actinomycetota bacterium]